MVGAAGRLAARDGGRGRPAGGAPPGLALDGRARSPPLQRRRAEPGRLAECSRSGGLAVYRMAHRRPSRLMLGALALAGLLAACAAPTAAPTPPNAGGASSAASGAAPAGAPSAGLAPTVAPA